MTSVILEEARLGIAWEYVAVCFSSVVVRSRVRSYAWLLEEDQMESSPSVPS